MLKEPLPPSFHLLEICYKPHPERCREGRTSHLLSFLIVYNTKDCKSPNEEQDPFLPSNQILLTLHLAFDFFITAVTIAFIKRDSTQKFIWTSSIHSVCILLLLPFCSWLSSARSPPVSTEVALRILYVTVMRWSHQNAPLLLSLLRQGVNWILAIPQLKQAVNSGRPQHRAHALNMAKRKDFLA